MDAKTELIPEDAIYLARRVEGKYIINLYLWQDCYYEVSYPYGSDYIWNIKPIKDYSAIDLYIEAMHRIGIPEPHEWDRYENLKETGRMIAKILESDHLGFYHQLLWDNHLRWYCDMLEVRAAYLIDEIKTGNMKITEARDIAIRQLLTGDPRRHIKSPYIKIFEGDGVIQYPGWTYSRKSMAELLIDDKRPYDEGIYDVLGWIYSYGGWENETTQDYWDEQTKKIEEIKRNRGWND